MSRNRLGSSKATAAENEQMDTLRLLPSIPTNPSFLKNGLTLETIEKEKEKDLRILINERKHLDEALDKLNVLLALRKGGLSSLNNNEIIKNENGFSTSIGITTLNPNNGGQIKRKRKNSNSISPSPNNFDYNFNNNNKNSNLNLNSKLRKELYFDQLPLQHGRKVAFKLPKSKSNDFDIDSNNNNNNELNSIGGGGGGEDWILAIIKQCIGQDKMRYEVQDVDDGGTYNTTLRSIIPLPDSNSPLNLSSNPINLEDFPKNSQVLALYPDTTSFYRATVISPPLPGTGNGLGLLNSKNNSNGNNGKDYIGSKKGVYRLMFVDDDDNVQEVAKDDVVAVSNLLFC
uniref:SGF29 C-terminal domain-containing protein n=1 Tax=Kwoniella pini CBS 10737 TaxID=1296096 RepID=A0A1B9I8F9_9TREE|nr:uncharacterized protein I206_02522 [Kwoniella pini CBS 10737]OCF51806.1 hypothetical protein I206_02522 [Kwoniella pini CBS 10737]